MGEGEGGWSSPKRSGKCGLNWGPILPVQKQSVRSSDFRERYPQPGASVFGLLSSRVLPSSQGKKRRPCSAPLHPIATELQPA